jgi:flavin-dependent dehydrogenase
MAGGTSIPATWVVDAAGGQHWLARQLGIPRQDRSPRLIARYGYARGQGGNREEAPGIVADEAGWTWTAKIGPDLYHWTRLSFTGDGSQLDGQPSVLENLTPLGRPQGADVTWRIVERTAGSGYICVGDAAAVLDPASSHGVLKAIMSGMMAGHVIAENLAGAAAPERAIRTYTAWLKARFEADVTALTALYRLLPVPPGWVRD